MARPKKSGDVKRSVIVRFYVTKAEREVMKSVAAEAGLSLSDWLRQLALKAKPLLQRPSPDREIQLRFLAHYGKYGSLLNQVARQLNRRQESDEYTVPIDEVVYVLSIIKKLTEQQRKFLDHGSHQIEDTG